MPITSMNDAQMTILESFAGVTSQSELAGLLKVLKKYYAGLLKEEMQHLWEDGTLDQSKLDELRKEHLRTPYHQ